MRMKIVNFVKRVWILPVSHFALFDVFFNFKNFGRPPEVSVHSQIYHLIPDNSRPETWVQIRIKLNYAQNNVYKNCVISNSIWMIEGINVKINSWYHFINQQHQNLFEFHFNVCLSEWWPTRIEKAWILIWRNQLWLVPKATTRVSGRPCHWSCWGPAHRRHSHFLAFLQIPISSSHMWLR